MFIITKLTEAKKRVTIRLAVETDKLQIIKAPPKLNPEPVITALIVKVFKSHLIMNPPKMLPMDLTKKINEKYV
jgi:hypothetical protein